MSDIVINIDNISKLYRLGEVGTGSLAHDFNRWWHRVRGREDPYLQVGETNDRSKKGSSDWVWALRNISFEAHRGEVVGIIGRNGAGKSTLLKILSRVTTPTEGKIQIKGRVASLLEVGTGFHPELTGRENIFLNGAILGMRKAEIASKLDEIVDFSGVERYLDTPVKRYSSGMYVRLAFAVAAHLEPDIMIVDEVLAVGDATFQKKCLGKMKDVSTQSGRTVLFVSHNMGSIRNLATRCVYLGNGGVRSVGETSAVLDQYSRDVADAENVQQSLGKKIHVRKVQLNNEKQELLAYHDGSDVVYLQIEYETEGVEDAFIEAFLTDTAGNKLAVSSPCHFTGWRIPAEAGTYQVTYALTFPPLATGKYLIDVATGCYESGWDHYVAAALAFDVNTLVMRPAKWEYRLEYNAGFFIMDSRKNPTVEKLN